MSVFFTMVQRTKKKVNSDVLIRLGVVKKERDVVINEKKICGYYETWIKHNSHMKKTYGYYLCCVNKTCTKHRGLTGHN